MNAEKLDIDDLPISELSTRIEKEFGIADAPYSIAAAWQVVEEITDIKRTARGDNTRFMYAWNSLNLWACSAQEAAEDICKAVLKAVTNPTGS